MSDNVIIFSGPNPNWGLLPKANENIFAECSPISDKSCLTKKFPLIATSDNYYPTISDRKVYQVLVGRNRTDRTKPMHILNEVGLYDCNYINAYDDVDLCLRIGQAGYNVDTRNKLVTSHVVW